MHKNTLQLLDINYKEYHLVEWLSHLGAKCFQIGCMSFLRTRTSERLFIYEVLDNTKNFDAGPNLLEEETRLLQIGQHLLNFQNR